MNAKAVRTVIGFIGTIAFSLLYNQYDYIYCAYIILLQVQCKRIDLMKKLCIIP